MKKRGTGSTMKIGVFDSGIGGVTVLNHLREIFSHHEFLYFGDTANVPYGTKSVAQIKELAKAAAFRIHEKQIDLLIVACNTASSLALAEMKEVLAPVPVIGVVEAGVESIVESITESASDSASDSAPKSFPILILGTRATIKSKIYSTLLKPQAVFEQECPLLVPMIEEGWVDHPILHQTIAEYVKPYQKNEPGVALLACTHYPWIKQAFAEALPGWKIIDSAQSVAKRLQREFKINIVSVKSFPSISKADLAPVSWFFSDPDSVASFIFDIAPEK